ncbi:MAG TPA: hypothetical protein VGW34_08055 [Allosphingosinicella sp.]|nr:hypothetical protein [Allosphingosinicella sp.]
MLKGLFRSSSSRLPDEAIAAEARRRYKDFLDSCNELKQRGYTVQLCFSHLDRSKDFRPEELIRIDVEVSGTKRI